MSQWNWNQWLLRHGWRVVLIIVAIGALINAWLMWHVRAR